MIFVRNVAYRREIARHRDIIGKFEVQTRAVVASVDVSGELAQIFFGFDDKRVICGAVAVQIVWKRESEVGFVGEKLIILERDVNIARNVVFIGFAEVIEGDFAGFYVIFADKRND